MREKTITWFYIIGIVLALVGGLINGAGQATSTKGIVLAGVALSGSGIILALVFLTATEKQMRWGWFMLVFLLTVIAELINIVGVVLAPK